MTVRLERERIVQVRKRVRNVKGRQVEETYIALHLAVPSTWAGKKVKVKIIIEPLEETPQSQPLSIDLEKIAKILDTMYRDVWVFATELYAGPMRRLVQLDFQRFREELRTVCQRLSEYVSVRKIVDLGLNELELLALCFGFFIKTAQLRGEGWHYKHYTLEGLKRLEQPHPICERVCSEHNIDLVFCRVLNFLDRRRILVKLAELGAADFRFDPSQNCYVLEIAIYKLSNEYILKSGGEIVEELNPMMKILSELLGRNIVFHKRLDGPNITLPGVFRDLVGQILVFVNPHATS
jgi:hypothetical protein